jgi:RHS repeat-associated protein
LTGAVEYEHYLYTGGMMFGKFITTTATDGVTLATTAMEYYSKDNLGSIVAITDDTGAIKQRLSYDVWGKRRYPNGAADPNGLLNNPDMYHGFTGHEMLDSVGLIHMNGRLYDPVMGRFVSADFLIQSPDNLQSYNRYSYGWNNPLSGTDPSGQSFLGDFFSALLAPIASKNLRPFVAIGVTFIPGLNVYAAGFLSGMISSGGDLKNGIIGALTAGAFSGLHGMDYGLDKILAHGMVGGISSVLQGGDCGGDCGWNSVCVGRGEVQKWCYDRRV